MYKRFFKIILLIMFTLSSLIWINFFVSKNDTKINSNRIIIDQNYSQIGVPISTHNSAEYKKLITAFKQTSNDLQIPFLIRSWYIGHEIRDNKVNFKKSIDFVTYEVSDLSKSSLVNNFHQTFKRNEVYSTKNNKATKKIPKYGSTDFTVTTIKEKPYSTREGLFYIQTKNPEKVAQFIEILKNELNTKFNLQLTSDSYKPVQIPYSLIDKSVNIKQTAISTTVFAFIVLIIFLLSSTYEIGALSLLGLSTFKISNTLTSKVLYCAFAFTSFISISLELYYGRFTSIPITFLVMLYLFILENIISYAVIFTIQKFPISSLLIKRTYSKKVVIGLFILKGVFLTIILISAIPLGNYAYSALKYSQNINTTKYSNYAVFFPQTIGYNPDALINPREQSESIKNLYTAVNQKGGLQIDTSALGQNIKPEYKGVIINSNYLKFNPIYSVNNQKILIPEKRGKTIIFLPLANKNLLKKIKTYYNDVLKIDNIQVIFIKNNQIIIDEKGNKVSNYPYLTAKSDTENNDDVVTGDDRDPLKVALHGKSINYVYNGYKKELKKENLDDNLPQLVRADSVNYYILKQAEGDLYGDITLTLMSIIIFIVISIGTVHIYMVVFGRMSAIKQMLGLSLMRSYLFFWSLWLSQLFLTILFIQVYFGSITPAVLITLLIGLSIDILVTSISINKYVKEAVGGFLHE